MSKKHYSGNPAYKGRGLTVDVRNDDIETAIRLLGRKIKRDGLFKELQQKEYYEKPSVTKRRKQAVAQKRERERLREAENW